jgi:RNA polymerase sigma factor (sigma-70 family)
MVYGTALRLSGGNAAEAEDVSQMVFADLARKAPALKEGASVGAWLHRHTCFLMKNAIRSEVRRRTRETAAAEMHTHDADAPASGEQWEEIEGRLDRCLESLRETDRRILILRYFEGRALREVGEVLGIGDDAAQKRVSRALDRLRKLVTGPRPGLSSAGLATAMTMKTRAEVPASVAGSMARSALQLAGARPEILAASSGTAAVAAAWTGVAAMAALGVWRAWPHWHPEKTAETAVVVSSAGAPANSGGVGLRHQGHPGALAGADGKVRSDPLPPEPDNSGAAAKKTAKPRKSQTPDELGREAANKASTLHKWMIAYALDHGGNFPPDLSALLSANLGFPVDQTAEWFGPVIEYRGRTLTSSDAGGLLVMRYRVPDSTDKEVRLFVSGSSSVRPVDEPLPEDQPPAEPSPLPEPR